MNKLDQLKSMTRVVADTGDLDAIARYQPEDATTNPSLLLGAADLPRCQPLLDEARRRGREQGGNSASMTAAACDHFAVAIGHEVLQIVPGRVSTEVDARLTISPQLMQALAEDQSRLERRLDPGQSGDAPARVSLGESEFRWAMNEDTMAHAKLAEGIRLFARDQEKLEARLVA